MDFHARANGIANTRALTAQLLARLVKAEILATQLGDVNQALDIHRVQRDKDTEAGGRGDHAAVLLAQVLTHVFAFQPGFNIAAGLVSTTFVGAAVQTCSLPRLLLGKRHFDARGVRLHLRTGLVLLQAFRQFGMRFTGQGQTGQLVLLPRQNSFDDPMHQQIRVAPNRAGEVGVRLISQTEVTAVDRRVNGLLHGAQQHGVNLLRIGPFFGGLGDVLELARFGVVAQTKTQTQRFHVVAQNVFFLWRWAFMDPEQARVLALLNKVRTADVGRQHGFLDQAVRLIPYPRYYFFNLTAFIADDLRFSGFKIHGAAHSARRQQGFVDVMQIQQIVDTRLAIQRLWTAGVGQNGRDFGVSKARMAEHHGRVKLIGMHIALGRHQHVTHHAQTLDIGIERAQSVGEFFRQHGNHAAREIDTGRALIGVDIDGAAGFHIVAHIRNRHQQAPALTATHFGGLTVNSVIKVARIFPINRDQRHVG